MPDLRVILVGPTGLEQSLRRDASLEMVRARTALDAIGELSDPLFDDSPARSVVVVAPSVEINGDTPEFIESLRLIDPGVTVLSVGDRAPGYDGAAPRDADGETLRRALNGRNGNGSSAVRDAEAPEPIRHSGPGPDAPRVEAAPEPPRVEREPMPIPDDLLGDDALVELLLQGEDIEHSAEAIIRARLGADVTYEPGESGYGAPVLLGDGAVAGHLSSRHLSDEDLAPHAAWLSAWMCLSRYHAELRQAAYTDALTGAWNRRYFDRFLGIAIERARISRGTLTLMIFDIDNFKTFNDKYGHGAGDSILVETVKLLRSVIRPSDRVCRVGGDEFGVVFHEPDGPRDPGSKPPSSVFSIAKRFQRQICEHRFPKLLDEAPGTLTISAGLATYPWDGPDAASLVERADQLALQSKAQGKNAITLGPGAVTQCSASDFDEE